mmetsp:Transcript_26772/g.89075  ORF Transcript_26772/g.89075 Transcript_26772/m.89075 type:complete len:258 (+) Transcript_26772:854-1627(+)
MSLCCQWPFPADSQTALQRRTQRLHWRFGMEVVPGSTAICWSVGHRPYVIPLSCASTSTSRFDYVCMPARVCQFSLALRGRVQAAPTPCMLPSLPSMASSPLLGLRVSLAFGARQPSRATSRRSISWDRLCGWAPWELALLRMTQLQSHGTSGLQTVATLLRNCGWALPSTTDLAWSQIHKWPSSGTARPQNKTSLQRSSWSDSHTATEMESSAMRRRLRVGSSLRRHRVARTFGRQQRRCTTSEAPIEKASAWKRT